MGKKAETGKAQTKARAEAPAPQKPSSLLDTRVISRLTNLLILAALCAVTACERRGPAITAAPESPTTRPAADAPRLIAGMSDVEIIRAFELDPGSAKREVVQGKDGTSTTFTVGNQQVTVTRSLVSGVTVMASGPKSGIWPLGQP